MRPELSKISLPIFSSTNFKYHLKLGNVDDIQHTESHTELCEMRYLLSALSVSAKRA